MSLSDISSVCSVVEEELLPLETGFDEDPWQDNEPLTFQSRRRSSHADEEELKLFKRWNLYRRDGPSSGTLRDTRGGSSKSPRGGLGSKSFHSAPPTPLGRAKKGGTNLPKAKTFLRSPRSMRASPFSQTPVDTASPNPTEPQKSSLSATRGAKTFYLRKTPRAEMLGEKSSSVFTKRKSQLFEGIGGPGSQTFVHKKSQMFETAPNEGQFSHRKSNMFEGQPLLFNRRKSQMFDMGGHFNGSITLNPLKGHGDGTEPHHGRSGKGNETFLLKKSKSRGLRGKGGKPGKTKIGFAGAVNEAD